MRILAKLLLGFLAISLLCATVGLVAMNQMGRLTEKLRTISDSSIPSLVKLSLIDTEITNVKVAMRTLAHPQVLYDDATFDKQFADIEQARGRYRAALAEYEKLPMVEEEKRLYAGVKQILSETVTYNNELLALINQAKQSSGEERALASEALYELETGEKGLVFENLQKALRGLIEFNRQHYGVDIPAQAIAEANLGWAVILGVTIAAFACAMALGFYQGASISRPLRQTAALLDRLAAGDTSASLQTNRKDEFRQLAQSLNAVSATLGQLVDEARLLSDAAVEGRLTVRGDAARFKGAYARIVEGVNATLDAVISPLSVAALYLDRIAQGDLPPKISDQYRGEFNTIKDNLNHAIENIEALVGDTKDLVGAALAGRLSTRADASRHQGDYRKVVEGINQTLDAVIGPLGVAAEHVQRIARGEIPPPIAAEYQGDFNLLKNNLNQATLSITALVGDTTVLVKAAAEGQLATRVDAARHLGDFRAIVEGVNRTLDLVVGPVNELIRVSQRMAGGDLAARMEGQYRGDFEVLKSALNSSLDALSASLTQISLSVDQVAAGARQVAQASQSLSQGATEQAASLSQINASLTQISGQTRQNTENAVQMNQLAAGAKGNAQQGDRHMQDLVAAMADINTSAEQIQTITKAIDDISFQINLLALNANVEAARAGKYGKGFAVVAEEVRNLAVRSATSVQETTDKVELTINNIKRGNSLVAVTAQQLASIVDGAAQVAALAEAVAVASREQSQGLDQIGLGITQIDQVTQANTANAEQSAAASEQLSGQSQQVKTELARFTLSRAAGGPPTLASQEDLRRLVQDGLLSYRAT